MELNGSEKDRAIQIERSLKRGAVYTFSLSGSNGPVKAEYIMATPDEDGYVVRVKNVSAPTEWYDGSARMDFDVAEIKSIEET